MKKKILLGLGVLMCLGLIGCGQEEVAFDNNESVAPVISESDNVVSENVVLEDTVANINETEESETVANEIVDEDEPIKYQIVHVDELSDNLYDGQISIEGRVIQLPTVLELLVYDGFDLQEDLKAGGAGIVPAKETKSAFFKSKSESCMFGVSFINEADVDKYYPECLVNRIGIGVDNFQDRNVIVQLAGGVYLGISTYDEVIEVYGEPEKVEEVQKENLEKKTIATYTDGGLTKVNLSFDENSILSYITVEKNYE